MLGFKQPGEQRALEVEAHIGLEQEFFLVPRDAYLNRPDLQVCTPYYPYYLGCACLPSYLPAISCAAVSVCSSLEGAC